MGIAILILRIARLRLRLRLRKIPELSVFLCEKSGFQVLFFLLNLNLNLNLVKIKCCLSFFSL
jgi:hypothetical protein